VRLAPVGEDVLIAYRSGRNAVIVQLLTHAGGQFQGRWRTLVEPGVWINRVRLTSGTFDPFASLDNQWHLAIDADPQGRSAIAVSLGGTDLPQGHSEYFGEPLDPNLVSGAIITVLDAGGARLRATPVDTHVLSEVHGIRWARDAFILAGRLRTEVRADGGGWDGFIAPVGSDYSTQLQVLDFNLGDVIFDVAALGDGRLVLAGSTGYVQNPSGGSISEAAEPLLAVLPSVGAAPQRVLIPAGPRENQIRTVGAWHDQWLIGGVVNGPGTHSADSDPALLTWDGFLRSQDF
jgi:hypothetical protein